MAIDMADDSATSRAPDVDLQHLDDLFCNSQNIVTASDLYAYHVLPSIIADLDALGVTSDQQYHADVVAEMRWSVLDVHRQLFWDKQVEKYMTGDMEPLDRSTYEDFLARHHPLHAYRNTTSGDEQDTPYDPATTPSKSLDLHVQGSVNHDLHGKEPTVVASRSARLTEKTKTMEACDVLRLAWIKSRRQDEGGAHQVMKSTSTVRGGAQHTENAQNAQNAETLDGFRRASINSHRQYEGDANEVPQTGPKAAKKLESSPMEATSKAKGYDQPSTSNGVKASGRTPPVVPPTFNQPAVTKLEAMVRDAVPEAKESSISCHKTNTKQTNVHPAPPVAVTKKRRSRRSRPIRAKGVQNNNHDDAIAHTLGGPVMHMQIPDYTTGISAILRSISKRLSTDPNITLQGRCHAMRVDFDPRAGGVTSIRARLLAAQAHGDVIGLDDRKLWSPKATIGFMLRFLVDWNRDSHAFQDCRSTGRKPKTAHRCANEFASRWTWLECLSGVIGPITYERRYTVIGTIMQLVRERAQLLCPAALTNGVYGLLPHDRNFACTLMTCFTYTTLSSEEYQDLMEQKMFRLNRRYGRLYLMQR